jgi:cell division protein FtsB
MKRVINALVFSILFILLTGNITYAKGSSENVKSNFTTQVKQKQQVIKQKLKNNAKLQAQVNKKSKQISDLYSSIFEGNLNPPKQIITEIETREAKITKDIQILIQIEKSIAKLNTEIKTYINQKNYSSALGDYEKIIDLLDKKSETLQKHDSDLSNYIQYIKSLQYK